MLGLLWLVGKSHSSSAMGCIDRFGNTGTEFRYCKVAPSQLNLKKPSSQTCGDCFVFPIGIAVPTENWIGIDVSPQTTCFLAFMISYLRENIQTISITNSGHVLSHWPDRSIRACITNMYRWEGIAPGVLNIDCGPHQTHVIRSNTIPQFTLNERWKVRLKFCALEIEHLEEAVKLERTQSVAWVWESMSIHKIGWEAPWLSDLDD